MATLENALQQLRAERREAQLARREVGSSNFSDRVAKRFWIIPERKPTNPSPIGSFTPENGGGQRARWAEVRKGPKPTTAVAKTTGSSQVKRTMSSPSK
jgi:hypothetical protein